MKITGAKPVMWRFNFTDKIGGVIQPIGRRPRLTRVFHLTSETGASLSNSPDFGFKRYLGIKGGIGAKVRPCERGLLLKTRRVIGDTTSGRDSNLDLNFS